MILQLILMGLVYINFYKVHLCSLIFEGCLLHLLFEKEKTATPLTFRKGEVRLHSNWERKLNLHNADYYSRAQLILNDITININGTSLYQFL